MLEIFSHSHASWPLTTSEDRNRKDRRTNAATSWSFSRLKRRTVRGSLHSRSVLKCHVYLLFIYLFKNNNNNNHSFKWNKTHCSPFLEVLWASASSQSVSRLLRTLCGSSWRLWPGCRCVRKWPSATWCPARTLWWTRSFPLSCLAAAEPLWWGEEIKDSLGCHVTVCFLSCLVYAVITLLEFPLVDFHLTCSKKNNNNNSIINWVEREVCMWGELCHTVDVTQSHTRITLTVTVAISGQQDWDIMMPLY